ncbi:hypothetical protein OEZ86_014665 [Tetradesmus obliquus]|nr:hypothetical protein OEZ86_014665 [Tetradesmus obliquus]
MKQQQEATSCAAAAMLSGMIKLDVSEAAMEVAEAASWVAADYAWDPHRLVAVQDSSATALHVNTAAGGTQPDSIVPPVLPVLESTPAPSERSVSPSACCKVEGCQRLLRDEKPYYQRFGVCEEHMRSLAITVNGTLCRFCQQCAKFEPVEAFDSNKRSCRARLIEHNKRRRKLGVSHRSLRKQRRNAAASSKAADKPGSGRAAGELPAAADAAQAGAAGEEDDEEEADAAAGLDEDAAAEAEQAQQQQQQLAAGSAA